MHLYQYNQLLKTYHFKIFARVSSIFYLSFAIFWLALTLYSPEGNQNPGFWIMTLSAVMLGYVLARESKGLDQAKNLVKKYKAEQL